jgi:L-lactate dehydrogenase (cytochrome)
VDAWKGFSGSKTTGPLAKVYALDDFELLAKKRLPRAIYGYVAGAAETNRTRDDNRAVFDEWAFVPRVLRDVSQRDLSTELFGVRYSTPIGISPMGIAALSCYQGDVVMARAAAEAGIPYVLSGTALTSLERIAEAAPGSWFQAYMPGSMERIDALVDRVRRAAYQVLVVTVDVPVSGNRENSLRAGFSTPLRPSLSLAWDGITHPHWTWHTWLRTLRDGMPHFENSFAERGAPILSKNADRDFSARENFNWDHIDRVRQQWPGKLVLKGILTAADAGLAKSHGADGLILSNHGGRQLDGAVSPMRVLSEVVHEVGDLPVMIDSGFRRGSDVLKALALGARMAFLGRPFNYAAAAAGQAGVAHAIALLQAELSRNMALLGATELKHLTAELMRRR